MEVLQVTGQIRCVEIPLRSGRFEPIYGLQSGYLFTWRRKYPTVNSITCEESPAAKKGNKGNRYLKIHLQEEIKEKHFDSWKFVHRLIIMMFPDICGHFDLFRTQADHINGLKRDNRAENLRTVTPSENMKARFALRKQKITTFINH